ncbi:hypothetical protein CR513_46613, partial [Mucuna pruriens]
MLQRFHMQNAKAVSTPLTTHFKLNSRHSHSNEAEKTNISKVPYASMVDSLMYAIMCTRPDNAHVVGIVSRFLSNPGREHLNVVKWILRYLHGTSDYRLCFGGDKPTLMGYLKFTSGYLIKFTRGAMAWQSKLQKCVTLSTTEAKFIVIAKACNELFWTL